MWEEVIKHIETTTGELIDIYYYENINDKAHPVIFYENHIEIKKLPFLWDIEIQIVVNEPLWSIDSVHKIVCRLNMRHEKIFYSIFNVSRTAFVCLLLFLSTAIIQDNVTKLVLNPVEKMIKKLWQISECPFKTN